MAVETNARIEFSVASVEEWEKVNPKLHQGEPVFAKKPSGKYILKVGAPGGSTYKNAVVVWDQDDAETKMTSTQEAAALALASKNAASASASAAKSSENAAAASKSAAAMSAENAKASETNAYASANTAKAWSMSDSSPDGVSGNKSAKTWAEEANTSASNSADSAIASQSSATESASSATNAANSANASKQSASASANSASASASSASTASTSASNAKISETNASNSAKAAKQSEENSKTWDPTQYVKSVTESNGKVTVTKGGGESTIINLIDTFYPIGTVYISADKTKTKADFPFMTYGIWEELPANLCLQTGIASEAGTQRSAGLPNITGKANIRSGTNIDNNILANYKNGAITCTNQDSSFTWYAHIATENGQNKLDTLSFNASNSNPIYGKSSTVQPPAYMVRAWVRTA